MQIIAEQKNTRQSPRKVRLVADAVRKLPLDQALRQLGVMEKRASLVVMKVIRQALANAQHNHRLSLQDVMLKNIIVNAGPTYKRWRAASRGRAHTIFKRSSHVRVILETKSAQPAAKTAPKAAAEKPAEQKTEPKKSVKQPKKTVTSSKKAKK